MNRQPLFSIIIPTYCRPQYIRATVESIKSQGLEPNDYEVILVDDASPGNSAEIIEQEIAGNPQYKLIRHAVNRRQGGARNTGVSQAKGKWIVFIDSDDVFAIGALAKIKTELLSTPHIDILFVENAVKKDDTVNTDLHYSQNQRDIVSGRQFILNNEISWTPWNFIYDREFLLSNNLKFIENLRYEDVDFIFRSLLKAKAIRYVPIISIVQNLWGEGQTSYIGNNFTRIDELYKLSQRIKEIAQTETPVNSDTAAVIFSHHFFMHKVYLQRYLWRLDYKQIKYILKNYPLAPNASGKFLQFLYNHHTFTAALLTTLKLPLSLALKVKNLIQ